MAVLFIVFDRKTVELCARFCRKVKHELFSSRCFYTSTEKKLNRHELKTDTG